MKKLEKVVMILGIIAVGLATIFGGARIISNYTQKQVPAAELQVYIEKISPMSAKIATIMDKIAPLFANSNASQQEALKEVGAAKNKLIVIEEEAKGYSPPANLASTHDRFKQAVGNYVDSFKLTEVALQQNDSNKSKQAADLLMKGSDGLNKIAEEITAMREKK